MGLLGKAIKVTGKVVGKTLECGINATGYTIASVARCNDNEKLAEKSLKISRVAGKFSRKATETLGCGLGIVVDTAVKCGSITGGVVGENIVKINGGDDKAIKKAKIIGSAVGGGVVGLATGDLIGSGLTSVVAATGVASTGTAISTLHGAAATNATLAAIGGGALSAGGGGIAAGQSILHGIDCITAVSSGVEGVLKESNKKEKIFEFENEEIYIKGKVEER